MGIFTTSKSRIDVLEETLLRYMEKEDTTSGKIVQSIESLRSELSTLSAKLIEIAGDNNIQLLKMKQDILNICYEELALKKELTDTDKRLNEVVTNTSKRLSTDLSHFKHEVYVVMSAIISVTLIFSWLIDHGVLVIK